MKKMFEKNINKALIIAIIVLVIVTIIAGIIWYVKVRQEKEEISYEDKIICKNYFDEIAINLDLKKVKRDGIDTTFQEEFGISKEDESYILSSKENLQNFFNDSTFEITREEKNIVYIRNLYQTKKIIVEKEEIDEKHSFDAISIKQMPSGLYILEYDSQKKAKAAVEYFKTHDAKNVINDEIVKVTSINDESQTMYGEHEDDISNDFTSRGVTAMGLDNFQNIIKENGNPSEVVVATVGYGVSIGNEFFNGRISDRYYNFFDNKKEVSETISQGSRIAQVIVDSTTDNIKLLPIKVVNDEGYTSIVALVNGIEYATKFSNVICYELTNSENPAIDISLKNAYKENVAVCAVTTKENQYPANHSTTIATASVDKDLVCATYSGSGKYIDFAASSTDIKEIFNRSSTVSRWSGVQYSNAYIASEIALIKTYNKDFSILDVYNELKKYSVDLGENGKDDLYGYGLPNFSKIMISDIDRIAPNMNDIQFDNEQWEKVKNIKITANDNIRILGWQISNSENQPSEWNELSNVTPNFETTAEIDSNGNYYIWVKDSANNTTYKQIEVNKVDAVAPNITYTINKDKLETDGYVTINVTAEDSESGLSEMPYSWDNTTWGKENNMLKVTENGRYTIYCRDNVGNVSSKEIVVDCFAIKANAIINDGIIIKSITPSTNWNNNTNQDVQIIFNNTIDIVGWQITTENVMPLSFVQVKQVASQNGTNNQTNNVINSTGNNSVNSVSSNNNANIAVNSNLNVANDFSSKYNSSNTYVAVTASFDAGVTYYVWVEDSRGSVYSQSFRIEKVEF